MAAYPVARPPRAWWVAAFTRPDGAGYLPLRCRKCIAQNLNDAKTG